MPREDDPRRTRPGSVSLGAVLGHVSQRCGFVGMIGMTWGFMLGGALLMGWMTALVAAYGLSAFNTGLCDAAFGLLMLAVYWAAANEEYREHRVADLRGFLAVFGVSLVVSAFLPLALAWTALAELRARWSPGNDSRQSRARPVGQAQGLVAAVGRQVSGPWAGRSAHNL